MPKNTKLQIQAGTPTESGVYVVYVAYSDDPTCILTDRKFMLWLDGKWGYLGSGENYRGNVYGWIGPIPAMRLTIEEN